jgi:hypothetical protein
MKWITRSGAKTDRIACPWLIRRFIDPQAIFVFVDAPKVRSAARALGGKSFDAPNAQYTHRDGKCTFEVLMEEFKIDDPALAMLARIVHGADIKEDRGSTPQSEGLRAIGEGFAITTLDDHEKLRLQFPMYDALFAWCRNHINR